MSQSFNRDSHFSDSFVRSNSNISNTSTVKRQEMVKLADKITYDKLLLYYMLGTINSDAKKTYDTCLEKAEAFYEQTTEKNKDIISTLLMDNPFLTRTMKLYAKEIGKFRTGSNREKAEVFPKLFNKIESKAKSIKEIKDSHAKLSAEELKYEIIQLQFLYVIATEIATQFYCFRLYDNTGLQLINDLIANLESIMKNLSDLCDSSGSKDQDVISGMKDIKENSQSILNSMKAMCVYYLNKYDPYYVSATEKLLLSKNPMKDGL